MKKKPTRNRNEIFSITIFFTNDTSHFPILLPCALEKRIERKEQKLKHQQQQTVLCGIKKCPLLIRGKKIKVEGHKKYFIRFVSFFSFFLLNIELESHIVVVVVRRRESRHFPPVFIIAFCVILLLLYFYIYFFLISSTLNDNLSFLPSIF